MNTVYYPFSLPSVLFSGIGAVETVGSQVKKYGAKKIMLVTDVSIMKVGIANQVKKLIEAEGVYVDVYTDIEPEPSVENLENAVGIIKKGGYDLLAGVGGGSVIDSTKVIAALQTHDAPIREYIGLNKFVRPGLPTVMLPTTSGTGAEVTINAVFKDKAEKLKKVVVSPYLMPTAAIIDPMLTLTVPPGVTAATGLDALTHAIEAYTAIKSTPQSDLYAVEAIKLIGKSLRSAVGNGRDITARYNMSLGSLFAGIANANASVGAVHALSYPLGGEFDLPHGVANALMLPHVMEFNFISNVPKFAMIAKFLGVITEGMSQRDASDAAVKEVTRLSLDVGVMKPLRDYDIPKEVLPAWAENVINTQERLLSNSPRSMRREDALMIYERAW